FFFSLTAATTSIYTLSLHDALPICGVHVGERIAVRARPGIAVAKLVGKGAARLAAHIGAHAVGARLHAVWRDGGDVGRLGPERGDRKSTRLNSSHVKISYAVFCLKK